MRNRGGRYALLMMIMPSMSTTFFKFFEDFYSLPPALRATSLSEGGFGGASSGEVAFAEGAVAELEAEDKVAALGVDVDHGTGVVLFIVHALAAAGDTVFELDIRGRSLRCLRPFCLGYDDCTARVKGRGKNFEGGKMGAKIPLGVT